MWKQVAWWFFVLAVLTSPSIGLGGMVYAYTGVPFEELYGDHFQWGDLVTGYVRFDTEPTANSVFGAANVADFEFSAGEVTVSSADSTILDPEGTLFVFDASGRQIYDWYFHVGQSWGEGISTNTTYEFYPLGDEVFSLAQWSGATGPWGSWSVVPEPSTVGLWLLAGLAAAVYGWRRRACVDAARR